MGTPSVSSAAVALQCLSRLLWWLLVFLLVLISVEGVIGGEDLLTPKAYVLNYWENHVAHGLPMSEFLMDKASPLTAAQYAEFSKIAVGQNLVSSRLPEFCAKANLMCLTENDEAKSLDINFKRYNHYHKDSDANQKEITSPESLDFLFTSYRQKGGRRGTTRPPRSLGKKFRLYNQYVESGDDKEVVPPGIFFREAMLKPGTRILMPDFIDKNPIRSFLPRDIVSKLPFSSTQIAEIRNIFHARNDSSMSKIVTEAIDDCEQAPNLGETKRCVASIEDMIDFATVVLGRRAVVRTMGSTAGSGSTVLLGDVKGMNGGKLTRSVSCHQTLYPYLLYYCHSVNGIHVYEADILDPKTKSKINTGIAICHQDTSSWSPAHPAFIALGHGPRKIEVCHWIFQNDLTWVTAD